MTHRIHIPGRAASYKNHKQIARNRNGQCFIVSGKTWKLYERRASGILRDQWRDKPTLQRCSSISIAYTPPDRRSIIDPDNVLSGVLDLLVRAGVIRDDCGDVVGEVRAHNEEPDKEAAGVAVEIEED